MLCNYHTHTPRCHHASENDRAYIEKAIEGGVTVLGFADHSPMFPMDDVIKSYRMSFEDAEDYSASLHALAKEYEKDIKILIGFEAEYAPCFFEEYMKKVRALSIDYLILGQHFTMWNDDAPLPYFNSGARTEDPKELRKYYDTLIAGMKTGAYTYIAHPDVVNFIGDPGIFREESRRLCEAAKSLSIPLEYNYLGFRSKRCYPHDSFYQIAAEVGNDIMLGFDAHSPDVFTDYEGFALCREHMAELGLHVVEDVPVHLLSGGN